MPETRGAGGMIGAAGRGDPERVARLLDSDPPLAIARNAFGAQAVHAAHFGGHRPVVNLLLRRGVALDAFLAADFIALLMEHGADCGIRGNERAGQPAGQTAMDVAAAQGQHQACALSGK